MNFFFVSLGELTNDLIKRDELLSWCLHMVVHCVSVLLLPHYHSFFRISRKYLKRYVLRGRTVCIHFFHVRFQSAVLSKFFMQHTAFFIKYRNCCMQLSHTVNNRALKFDFFFQIQVFNTGPIWLKFRNSDLAHTERETVVTSVDHSQILQINKWMWYCCDRIYIIPFRMHNVCKWSSTNTK